MSAYCLELIKPSRFSYLRFISRLYTLRSHSRWVAIKPNPMSSIVRYATFSENTDCSTSTRMLGTMNTIATKIICILNSATL